MAKLFFSYSHRDEKIRDELEVHLSMLKRQRVIETWHDRRIVAGDEFGGKISENLESSDIILLLVSPYFLASEYCYDVETKRALERHEAGEARVIPIIVDPCEWKSTPLGRLLAMPRDGLPISKFSNIHDAFLQVTDEIRKAASEVIDTPISISHDKSKRRSATLIEEPPRSSNLRIRKKFTEVDRDRFREDSFKFVSCFFEESLRELKSRNERIETNYKQVDANSFVATIYENGESVSECKICLSNSFGGNSILYSSNKSSLENSFNNMLSVDDDGNSLGWKAMMNIGVHNQGNTLLTQVGAAESFWSILIGPLQHG